MTSRVATPNADSGYDSGLFCVTNKCLGDITVISFFSSCRVVCCLYDTSTHVLIYIAGKKKYELRLYSRCSTWFMTTLVLGTYLMCCTSHFRLLNRTYRSSGWHSCLVLLDSESKPHTGNWISGDFFCAFFRQIPYIGPWAL
jgi:hypothetical protein